MVGASPTPDCGIAPPDQASRRTAATKRTSIMPVCRVCRSEQLEQFLDLGDQPHCNSLLLPDRLDRQEPFYPLRTWFCHNCTTVQIDHTVPKEEVFGEYLYVSGTTETLRRHLP